MLFLAILGKNVEDAFGSLGYLVVYFAAMTTQTAMTLLFGSAADAQTPNLGASGAIAGLEDMVWLSRGPLAQVHELPL
jgi:rhomboid family protein